MEKRHERMYVSIIMMIMKDLATQIQWNVEHPYLLTHAQKCLPNGLVLVHQKLD